MTFNFYWMLPSDFEVPALYSVGDHLAECHSMALVQVQAGITLLMCRFGQFVRALGQVTDSHLLKSRYPLGKVRRLVTHPSNVPDCYMLQIQSNDKFMNIIREQFIKVLCKQTTNPRGT